jgi:hypothetical protein
LTAADAKRNKRFIGLPAMQFLQRSENQSRPGHADWVTKRNPTTIHIQDLLRDLT